jgi:hypothetical protein
MHCSKESCYSITSSARSKKDSGMRGKRAENIARARELLTLSILPVDAIKPANTNANQPQTPEHRWP